jgi:hypothetical protein
VARVNHPDRFASLIRTGSGRGLCGTHSSSP